MVVTLVAAIGDTLLVMITAIPTARATAQQMVLKRGDFIADSPRPRRSGLGIDNGMILGFYETDPHCRAEGLCLFLMGIL
jgi:hypothetical protein